MLYELKDVLREVNNGSTGELDRMVLKSHHTPEDFSDGDIQERIDEFDYYHLVSFDLTQLDREEFSVDDDLIEDYVRRINNESVENMPPLLISDDGSVIDGVHRLNALLDLGFESFPVYVGSKDSLSNLLKKENKSRSKRRP